MIVKRKKLLHKIYYFFCKNIFVRTFKVKKSQNLRIQQKLVCKQVETWLKIVFQKQATLVEKLVGVSTATSGNFNMFLKFLSHN